MNLPILIPTFKAKLGSTMSPKSMTNSKSLTPSSYQSTPLRTVLARDTLHVIGAVEYHL